MQAHPTCQDRFRASTTSPNSCSTARCFSCNLDQQAVSQAVLHRLSSTDIYNHASQPGQSAVSWSVQGVQAKQPAQQPGRPAPGTQAAAATAAALATSSSCLQHLQEQKERSYSTGQISGQQSRPGRARPRGSPLPAAVPGFPWVRPLPVLPVPNDHPGNRTSCTPDIGVQHGAVCSVCGLLCRVPGHHQQPEVATLCALQRYAGSAA